MVSGGVFFQRESAMPQPSISKTMTTGESGLALVFAVSAFLCLVASAKALDAPFAFHAGLSAAASLAAVFFIINRYYDRPAALPPRRSTAAQLQHGPDQVHRRHGDVLGHRRLPGRADHRLAARLSRAELRSAVDQLRPPAAAAHLGGDLRLRRQRADRARRSTSCSAPAARGSPAISRPGSSCSATTSSSSSPAPAICSASPSRKEYAEPEWYADLWLTIVWVTYLLVFLGTLMQAQGAAHLRRELVLSRLHRHHRGAASRQQPGDAGLVLRLEVLHRLVAACRMR